MDMVLRRVVSREDGILDELVSDDIVSFQSAALEHAYTDERGGFKPKLPEGIYKCVRGTHRLEHMPHPFETFQIMNVPNHTNILFHVGNFNNDSDGCVLLGEKMNQSNSVTLMVGDSRNTFERFMNLQRNVNEFILTVISAQSQIGLD